MVEWNQEKSLKTRVENPSRKKIYMQGEKKTHESLPIFLFRISNPKEWKMRLL
jgi:hypothetical protein